MQRPLNILLIEDHDDTAFVMSRLLGKDGHAVTRAGTVAEARDLCGCGKFDLVITDRQLPDGDAWAMLDDDGPAAGIPVVTISGKAADPDGARQAPATCKAQLMKPVTLEALRAAVSRATAG